MALEPHEIDKIAQQLSVCLVETRKAHWVDPEIHAEHHEWVQARLANQADWRALRRKVIESAVLWAVPLIIGFVLLASWNEIVARIAHKVVP